MQAARDITFGPFRFDLADECLWRGTQAIALRPKAFAVLKLLVEHPGRLVTKQQVIDVVWPDTFVGDAVLKDNIRSCARHWRMTPDSPGYIETAHRRGYRFIGKLSEVPSNTPNALVDATISELAAKTVTVGSSATSGSAPEGLSVLVADDEARARQWIIDLLRRGSQVAAILEASDGLSAVELIQNRRPDLVFLDVQMCRAGSCV